MQLSEVKKFFEADVFAMEIVGITIDSASTEQAECSLIINSSHLNANGAVQGGVIYTLADFTFAVAANCEGLSTVTLSNNINYIKKVTGTSIRAIAKLKTKTSTMCYYDIDILDNLGVLIAKMSSQGYILKK